METRTLSLPNPKKENALKEEITTFYDEATEDYSFWSKDLNMHFGYFKFFSTHLFKRDFMLNEMNNQIYNRLQLSKKNKVADLGCGMGGTMRYFLNKNKLLTMIGFTLSSFQVAEGNKLLKNKKGIIIQEDYNKTRLQSNTMDGCIAIESFCHTGHDVQSLKEAYRILKPNANFVMGDAFLKKHPLKLCLGSKYSYKKLCKGWSLNGLGVIAEVEKKLQEVGFKKVIVENISVRVAPSVFHVPFAIIGFLIKRVYQNKKVKKQSWNNLKASFYALLSGLHSNDFGYYIITATK